MRAIHDFSGQLSGQLLTERQAQVLAFVANRLSLKQIACELSISESAVNQHVRALKRTLGVNSLAELAETYRAISDTGAETTCRKPTARNSELPNSDDSDHQPGPNELGPVVSFEEPVSYRLSAPWEDQAGPRVVLGVLNGANSKLLRAALIVGISFGLLALVLVGFGVAQGLTAALSG